MAVPLPSTPDFLEQKWGEQNHSLSSRRYVSSLLPTSEEPHSHPNVGQHDDNAQNQSRLAAASTMYFGFTCIPFWVYFTVCRSYLDRIVGYIRYPTWVADPQFCQLYHSSLLSHSSLHNLDLYLAQHYIMSSTSSPSSILPPKFDPHATHPFTSHTSPSPLAHSSANRRHWAHRTTPSHPLPPVSSRCRGSKAEVNALWEKIHIP
ncbi:hypothetical protein BDQ17DRAFT_809425 [Cyathus striatus]|nr:hypothetical protein BDQ17DRAFT_809425 [Cyathus striatus]